MNRLNNFYRQLLEDAVLENGNYGTILTDNSGLVLVMSRTASRWLGYEESETVGVVNVVQFISRDYLVEYAKTLSQELNCEVEPNFEALSIRARHGVPDERDWMCRRKDDSCFEGFISVNVAHNEQGEPAGFAIFVDNRTERLARIQAIQESEERYRSLVEVMEEGVMLQDANGTVLTCNTSAERMLGMTKEQMNAPYPVSNPWSAIDEDGMPFPASCYPLSYSMATGQPCSRVVMGLRRVEGEVTWLSINSRALFKPGETTPHAVMMSFTDITERKRAEADLAHARDAALEAARLKTAFLANSSHEIRTPLNAIVGMLGLLQGTPLTAHQRNFVDSSVQSAETLLEIINDLLDLSKIEAGKFAIEVEEMDVRSLVEDAMELVAMRAYAKGIELANFIADTIPPLVCGDPGRLRQILTNLLSNAVKFTTTGEIVVRAVVAQETPLDLTLRFEVSDTGPGLSPQFCSHIFEPFWQGQAPTGQQIAGTGLGLAICRQLVELMGGDIWVESTLGHGSTFAFTVRLQKLPTGRIIPEPFDPSHAVRRVLVMAGNKIFSASISHAIRSWGIACDEAADCETAYRVLTQAVQEDEPYELVLFDERLDSQDNSEFAQAVMGNPGLGFPRFIILAAPHRGAISAAESYGSIISKPVKRSHLIAVLTGAGPITSMSAPQEEPAFAAPGPPKSDYSKLRILIVEDNPMNQQVALFQLSEFGCQPMLASNGVEALEMLKQNDFDLIFMDCQMPVMDGYEATAEIRRREAKLGLFRTRIVALTAYAMSGDREKCIRAGMDEHLSKPVRPDDFQLVLERMLQDSSEHDWSGKPLIVRELAPLVLQETSLPALLDPAALSRLRRESPVGVFEKLLEIFLVTTPKYMTNIETLAVDGNWAALARQAHALGGSCSHFGVTSVVQTCLQLEQASIQRDGSVAVELVVELRESLKQLYQEMEQISKGSFEPILS